MAWIAVNKNNEAYVFNAKPMRHADDWICSAERAFIGSYTCKILLGYVLTWDDEPVKVKEIQK